MMTALVGIVLLLSLLVSSCDGAPLAAPTSKAVLIRRAYEAGVSQPYFPDNIASCNVCGPSWGTINSCAAAAPAFQSFTEMLLNPASFVDVIKCACTDTFSSVYPQCVDCFVQTNQCEQYLGVPTEAGASSILNGIRQVCGIGSALLGGVAASQSSANISYTYTGVPSQGYPTTTSYGPGGLDLGSAEGAKSSSERLRAPTKTAGLLVLSFLVLSV